MMLVIRIMSVSVVAILLACAPVQLQLQAPQVQLPPERSYHRGYSLIPLDEKGWFITQSDHNWLTLIRYGSNPGETYVITTIVWGPPTLSSQSEFINVVKENYTKGLDTTRFKTIELDVTPYPKKGEYCARVYVKNVDRTAVTHADVPEYMIMEIVELSCIHPTNANMAINVSYSHRHYPDQNNPGLLEKAETLFNSVEFEELK